MKPGYKQTEVGVIPEEWEVDSLGCIGHVIRGSSPRPKGDRRFYGGNVPRLMVEDVTRDRKYVTPIIDFLTVDGAKLSRPCKKGTLTVVCSGTPSVVGLPSILAVDACIHDGMLGLVHLKASAEPEYLFYRLTDLQEQLHAAATHGGTFVNLTTKGFGAFRIAVAPLPEQRAIAEALSDVDGLLGGLDRLIAKKRDLKQAAMQQLLTGQTRLPGFHGEWEMKTLGSIGKLKNGLNKDSSSFGHGLPFVNLMDVFGVNAISSNSHLGLVASTKMDREVYDLRQGDVLFIRSSVKPSGVGLTAVVERDLPDTVYSGFLIRFRDEGTLDSGFKKHCFYSDSFRKKVIAASSVSANTNINQNALAGLTLLLPPTKAEQTAIAAVLSEMDGELAVLEQRREKTRALKQAMMQELLTGRTRLV